MFISALAWLFLTITFRYPGNHRLPSVRRLDRSYFLDDDCKVIEAHTHDKLVALDGYYAKAGRLHCAKENLEDLV